MRTVVRVCMFVITGVCGLLDSSALAAEESVPPSLPPPPAQSLWPDATRDTLKKALDEARQNPVSAYLRFAGLLKAEDTKNRITVEDQRTWLVNATAALRPSVQALVQRDYTAALQAQDLRGALIAVDIASKIKQQDSVGAIADLVRRFPKLSAIWEASQQGTCRCPPVWKVTELKVTRMSSYSESYGLSSLSVTPKDGHELVKVTAKIENVSPNSDPPYVASTLPGHLRIAFDMDEDEWIKINGPKRLASSRYLSLKTSAGNFPCQFVCKDSDDELIGGTGFTTALVFLRMGNAKVAEYPGAYVEKGEAFNLAVLFSVPKGASGLELIVLGSPPVAIQE